LPYLDNLQSEETYVGSNGPEKAKIRCSEEKKAGDFHS